MFILQEIAKALSMSLAMFWQILWPLILGFGLSAIVQALVSKKALVRLLGDDSAKSITLASLFGIASSSCSYAAIALARSLFVKGANFTAAMAFQFASTNLVIELGITMVILLGWQFTAAEFVGGPIMIAILWLLLRATLRPRLVQLAREQAVKGLLGRMEGHAEMDMSVVDERPLLARATSPEGFTSISQYFVMDWLAVWKDIAGGLLICRRHRRVGAGLVLECLLPVRPPHPGAILGPLIGPLVAIAYWTSIGSTTAAEWRSTCSGRSTSPWWPPGSSSRSSSRL